MTEEGDTVLLKLNIANGYRIKEINGRKAEILQEERVYYLVVPRGGCVLLSMTLKENRKNGSGTKTGKNDSETL